jgi:hypothetical protein
MATIVEVNDPSKFDETLAQISAEQETVICIITGVTDPVTGKNWCPDCEVAKPNIKEYILDKTTGKVILCIVERSTWVGRSDHPYKASSFLKVKGVPTILVIAHGDTIVMRAEKDEDFQNKELLTMIAKGE